MSNYLRKAKRNKYKLLKRNHLRNPMLVYWNKEMVCPYNHQNCNEINCKGCAIHKERI